MKEHFLEFQYDEYGRGDLKLHNDSLIEFEIKARTGSVSRAGNLVNKMPKGIWKILKPAKDTTERAMEWEKDHGWKVRLYRYRKGKWIWTHYLIHPDGSGRGLNRRGDGTAGCIGTQGNALQLRCDINAILTKQDHIKVYVNTPIPKD